VGSVASANNKFAIHLQAIIDREYEPVQNGTKVYFQACEHDQHKAKSTNTCDIPKAMLLLYAQQAFRKAVDKNKIQEIENSWALIFDNKEQEFNDIYTKYEYFKAHYTKHLWNLVRNDKTKQTGAQAHVVEEQGIMIADLQGTMQSEIDSQNQLQDQDVAQAQAGYYNANSYNAPPTSVVATTTTTATNSNSANSVAPSTTYSDIQGMIQQVMQGVMEKNTTSTNTGNRKSCHKNNKGSNPGW